MHKIIEGKLLGVVVDIVFYDVREARKKASTPTMEVYFIATRFVFDRKFKPSFHSHVGNTVRCRITVRSQNRSLLVRTMGCCMVAELDRCLVAEWNQCSMAKSDGFRSIQSQNRLSLVARSLGPPYTIRYMTQLKDSH